MNSLRCYLLLMIPAVAFIISSCTTIYYNVQEKLGNEKRDILVSRVEAARDTQEDTGEQFQTAFERFKELTDYDGGSLEAKYNKLNSEFERCESRAQKLNDRIDAVESVAKDMFGEWEKELDQYTNDNLRRSSKEKLEDTRDGYQTMINAMRAAESKIDPVLDVFRDQVLYLKHNLNAAAISSLQSEVTTMEQEVENLIKDMQVSISEANDFINQMRGEGS